MIDLSKEPARVGRKRAMQLLSIPSGKIFAKVVDANPDLVHKLKGEQRAKYLTSVIARLLQPVPASSIQSSSKGGKHFEQQRR
jgi:hypothetical protein